MLLPSYAIPSFKRSLLLCFLVVQTLSLSAQFERNGLPVSMEVSMEHPINFRHDSTWRGGDGASSIALGNGSVLWLFGDSFVSNGGPRSESVLIRNSIGLQRPGRAEPIRFWHPVNQGQHQAVFQSAEEEWLWPGHGVMLEGKCLIFFMVMSHSSNELGFESKGWKVGIIHNPMEEPEEWRITYHDGTGPDQVMIGTSAVLVEGEYLYVFGVRESQQHETYLFRFPMNIIHEDSLPPPKLWNGETWRPYDEDLDNIPPLFNGQTEFSVHFDSTLNAYLQIQTVGFGRATIVGRTSNQITGPWSDPFPIFQPPVSSDSQIIYAAKAHPERSSDKLIITYQVNDLNFERLLEDESVYYPQTITVRWD